MSQERKHTGIKILGVPLFDRTEEKTIKIDTGPHPKRLSPKPPTLSPDMEEPFSSVAAAITARLGIEGIAGEYPLRYGDMGSGDVPINELEQLGIKLTDVEIAQLFIKRYGSEVAKNDGDTRQQVIMAIGSIRGATPFR